ncbi:DUF6374 family protein [Nocardia bovistercoris]|uniref:Uncharacterized protein n=1 Tax=Nocardia bovistercoris TaxID=2785916 RepID=A0A931N361_9NOCA|nr:DUF6374 family protein [Nocardia bovistercoris]MBH0776796.1 hypothetical protein [Nocardia bovistercoris]
MSDPDRIDFARAQVEDVRRALLDAAAFGKTLRPAPLEGLAGKLAAALRIYREVGEQGE